MRRSRKSVVETFCTCRALCNCISGYVTATVGRGAAGQDASAPPEGLHAAGDRSGWPVHPLPSLSESCPCPGPLPADGLEGASSSRRSDAQGERDASTARLDGARAAVLAAEPSVVYEYDAELIERKCAARPAPVAGRCAASPVMVHKSLIVRHSRPGGPILPPACLHMPVHWLR